MIATAKPCPRLSPSHEILGQVRDARALVVGGVVSRSDQKYAMCVTTCQKH